MAAPQYELDHDLHERIDAAARALAAPPDARSSMAAARDALALLRALVAGSEPVRQPDGVRRALWRALALLDSGALTCRHTTSGGDAQMRLGELCGLAAMRTALRCPASALSCSALWRGDSDVTADRRPVAQYTASDALSALRVLRNDMTECTLDEGLYQYCVALERRLAELIFYTHPARVHDAIDYRVTVDRAPDTYRGSQALLDVAWACLRGIYARILEAGALLHAAPEPAPDDAERAALGRLWALLRAAAGALSSDEVSTALKRHYVAQQLRPGDVELYRLAHRGIMPNAEGVMQAVSEPARMAAAMEAATLTVPRAIERHAEQFEPGAPEPQLLSLALFDMLCIGTGMTAVGFGAGLAFAEQEVRADPDRLLRMSHTRPLLAQMFNHWQLVVRGRVVRYNSLLRSLYHWLVAVRSEADARGPAAEADYVLAIVSDRGFYARLMAAAFPAEPAPAVAEAPPDTIEFE